MAVTITAEIRRGFRSCKDMLQYKQKAGAKRARVSLGMPVYNGEPYLEEALQSLLSQTFEDFELIISDNASTDKTSAICREYASADPRIVYTRNAKNLGLAANENCVIERARGEYFLLTHADDVRLENYLARTIEVLDADPAVVVCYTATRDIDEHGRFLHRVDPVLRSDSESYRERFRDMIRMDHICEADFGLTRLNVLRETRLHGDYADSDRVLLAEISLHGRIFRLPECLFHRRAHALQSTAIAPGRHARTVWYNPAYRNKLIFPHFRQLREYLAAIKRTPIDWGAKSWCYLEMGRWIAVNRKGLLSDLEFAARKVLRPIHHAVRRTVR